jgi:hypothetical protein
MDFSIPVLYLKYRSFVMSLFEIFYNMETISKFLMGMYAVPIICSMEVDVLYG